MPERLTAVKCAVRDLMTGAFVAKEGTAPSYVETARGSVSRCNLVAAVVDKPGSRSLLLDDGTGRVEARAFDEERLFENVLVGDVVLIVGRPRQYQGQGYVVAEIARRLGSPKWLELRRAELGGQKAAAPKREAKLPAPVKSAPKKERGEGKKEEVVASASDGVLALIRELDEGQGAPIETVIERSGSPATESVLTDLMAEGEIFEMRPGRVKVLE